MPKETSQDIFYLSPDGDMRNPRTKETTTVADLTESNTHARIVLIIPAKEGDAESYGYLAIVEYDL